MRRFLDWTAAQSASQLSATNRRNSYQNPSQSPTPTQMHQQSFNITRDLEIQHLTKLLHEIKYYQASSSPLPSAAGSQVQQEFVEKVHKTLPLFLNVFGNGLPKIPDSLVMPTDSSFHCSVDQSDNSPNESSPSSSKPNSPLPPRSLQMDRFPDLLPFAFTIARLFVSEVRQRASNKHAEDASVAILQFLNNVKPTTKEKVASDAQPSDIAPVNLEMPQGWILLLSLNTLASSQSSQIIQLLCDASLPSTLIKCLYLFFDLPAATKSSLSESETKEKQESIDDATTPQSTNSHLTKSFTQLLVQLCSNQSAINELIKKDDLRLLIGLASSQCHRHNKPWRKTAFQTLLAISKNMRDNFVYLEQNLCIQTYVENMHRVNSLGLTTMDEYIDMIKTLIEFLYNLDVKNRNQPRSIAPLVEQFKASRIVDLIEELIHEIDETIMQENQPLSPKSGETDQFSSSVAHQPSVSSEIGQLTDEYRRYGKRIVLSLTVMAKINIDPTAMSNFLTLKPLSTNRFEMLEQFKMSKPSAMNCILNYEALKLFKVAWSKCRDCHIIESILDATISLFNDDKYNYFIFESQQLLVYYMTSYNFKLFPYKVKEKLFKFLEFIVIETNYIPCLELGTLGTIIKTNTSPNNLSLVLKTLIACLRFNPKFSDIFREIGLLEVIVDALARNMPQENLSSNADNLEVLYLLLEASQYLLAGPNNLNCTRFNESGAARHVFNCLSKPEFFHLFIPAHSSSSDDSCNAGPHSRTGTPTLSHIKSVGQCHHSWQEPLFGHSQNKPSIKQLQKLSFAIIRQLILSTAGDEHLANLLGLLARNMDDLKNLESIDKVEDSGVDDDESKGQTHEARFNFIFLLSQEVNLKICILKSLTIILKESHRCRILFRKAGGFTYIVSCLDTLRMSLPSCELSLEKQNIELQEKWRKINSRRIWRLIKNSLVTIIVAMRLEPANIRAFSEGIIDQLTESLRELGCFQASRKTLPTSTKSDHANDENHNQNFVIYKAIFLAPPTRDLSTIANENTRPDEACCQLLRFLYDMSLDMADGTPELEDHLGRQKLINKPLHQSYNDVKSISFDQDSSCSAIQRESDVFKKRSHLHMIQKRPPSLDLNNSRLDSATLTFPSIIMSILDLIPSCPNEDLMVFTCIVIKSLFQHERNQQILCETGMVEKLLKTSWRISLTQKNHFLNEFTKQILEKLTRQAITASELKMFLRLGEPLRCKNLDEFEVADTSEETKQKFSDSNSKELAISMAKQKEKISTDNIETFVSMMSTNEVSKKIQPPFIEFDMNKNGFSSIFMPSIAPVNAKTLPPNTTSFLNSTLDVHTNEKNGILGGIGTTERQFPPNNGLTFSTWICIDKFPSRSSDITHNIRLLTIYRGSAATGKEYSCFRIQISALDRALTISTQETLLFDNDNRSDILQDPDCNLRIWTPELLIEGQWHNIAVTINRSTLKQSMIHVYVDGILIHDQRICYIANHVGSTNMGPLGSQNSNNVATSAAAFVNAFIGSLPQYRFQVGTRWKQGPCHLIEDALSANFISVIHAMGPKFIGNFQNPHRLIEVARDMLFQNDQKNHSDKSSHKHLTHQQSAAIVSAPHVPLTRVSSSNIGSSSSHQSSCSNLYHLAEDRVLLSIDARARSLMTLSRMRRIYTRFDCRQVSRVLGLALHENSTPILVLHNTGLHLNGASRGVGAMTVGHNHVRCFIPSPTQHTLFNVGGCYILLGFVAQAETVDSFSTSLRSLIYALENNIRLQAQMDSINGYQMLSVLFWKKKHLLTDHTLRLTFSLITDNSRNFSSEQGFLTQEIKQFGALRDLVCECFDLWMQTNMINSVLEFIYDLISSSNQDLPNNLSLLANFRRTKNLKYLRDMDLLPRMLRLLPQYNSQQIETGVLDVEIKNLFENNTQCDKFIKTFDTKAIYMIKQTVFELLNRTPRQSDILYFGQFLASLLPSNNMERQIQIINLRNILLKSLLQMITKNKQKEVNNAMQEEFVRILGFDWFMLFISSSHLDSETITIGYLNLMIVLSNDDLYANFKNPSTPNGGWLKEPTFPTIDGKFNIQLLGINVGVFFGLSGKRKTINQEVLEAPNFFLLSNCLTNLKNIPRIYLITFQTMMSKLSSLDSSVLDPIESFEDLNLDTLCDCLVGDTHHKRRQTLASIQLRCHELVVCLVYMVGDVMRQYDKNLRTETTLEEEETCKLEQQVDFASDVIKFLMYLYNNNQEFQSYCRKSDDLIEALSQTLIRSEDTANTPPGKPICQITKHPALKEVLEFSRLIIVDTMTDISYEVGSPEQLRAFDKFVNCLSSCSEAQGELVSMLLRQILLMIDSTARHNSIKTIGSSENVIQFQMLLVNSISVVQIVTDKVWRKELYIDDLASVLTTIEHQLCLAEQIFKFNEILVKHNPPYAFIMQKVLNRIILFALSRPMKHMSDKMLTLDLLKKIYDNRTIIILNHMHSSHSAQFFVCFTYCLMRIIEENSNQTPTSLPTDKVSSLIERQYGHPSSAKRISNDPSSTSLMLISMARKVWDAIYQSKKGILSEALDVSLSLPAFTLDTSLDLTQLKPDIKDLCERYWSNFIESEQKPKRRLQQRQSEPAPSSSATSAVNILSGRLTRVVNAASFVSRVVGATAGTMASNVNLVGEKLSQTRLTKKDSTGQTTPNVLGQLGQVGPSQIGASHHSDQNTELMKCHGLSKQQLEEASKIHISIIEDYIELQMSQKNHLLALHKYLCDEWLDTEYEILLRERAIFGPDYGSVLDKWCLDLTEGPRRMRKKMVNNTKQFYENYFYSPKQYNPSNKSLRYRPPMSYDSYFYYMKTLNLDDHLIELGDKSLERAIAETVSETGSLPESISPIKTKTEEMDRESKWIKSITPAINIELSLPSKSNQERASPVETVPSPSNIRLVAEPSSPRPSDVDGDDVDSTSFIDFSPEVEAETNSARKSENIDSLSVLRLLEKNERISHMFRCSRVQGLDTYEGLLLFGREFFYLIDGFTLLKTREIKDIDSLPPDAHDPIIPNSTPKISARSKKACAKFSFDSIIEVHKRRYLLQPIALEVFSSDGRNTLIVFPRNIRNKVYTRLMTVATQLTNNAHESLAGQKSNVNIESGSGLLSNLIGETSVTQRWVRGELSNFQYLMNLNTIAGRSYNDLMQYPIFPWILADYTSDYLDLNKPSTFRDLSMPVGAQTSERLEQFKRRYAEWDDSETPPYHYGTFYSSAMIVASYMVRMEPFTQHFLRLQGGHFDLADRMFHSIHDSWLSASKHNMADIKELIPEFFYLPEFLKNENKYDLGIKQNGMKLDDVVLPPWSKNDTREFIRLHRCALESEYVSAHLHEWIDLIFGYKQQGQAAIDAVNVFHHLFYEGNVDIYNTDIDPIKKNAVIGFINNFGQVPKQLFKKPHPARKVTCSSLPNVAAPILPSLSVATGAQYVQRFVLTHCPQTLKQVNSTFKDLRGPVGQIVQIDKSIVAVEQNKLLIPPEYCRYIAWGHADRSIRLGLYDSEKPIFVWEGSNNMSPDEILCCTIPNNRTMITAGTESLITVWKIEKMRSFTPLFNLYGHVEPVTCLASSQPYSVVVSGSRDRTAIIWDLNRFTFVRQLGGGPPDKLTHHGPISAIAINDSTGDIATCATSWLYLWTINGELLAQIDSLSATLHQSNIGSSLATNLGQLHLLSVCFSQNNEWDLDEVIVTGANDGSIALWSMRYYQCLIKDEAVASSEAAEVEGEIGDLEQEKIGEADIQETIDPEESEEREQRSIAPVSEPIAIKSRRRTDTLNSDWVKLSTSSTSTVDTIPVLRDTPTSLSNDLTKDTINSGPKISGCFPPSPSENEMIQLADREGPICSTPVSELETANGDLPTKLNSVQHDQGFGKVIGETGAKSDEIDGQSMSKANLFLVANDPSLIKFSKSDTSLTDSFVILGDTTSSNPSTSVSHHGDRVRPQSSTGSLTNSGQKGGVRKEPGIDQFASRSASKLLEHHCWKRELYLRMLIPKRAGRTPPSAITSLVISKDHRTIYVGDANGKISNFSTN